MQLMEVENQEPNPTVFSPRDAEPFVWAPRGDPRGDDVQLLPDTMLDNPHFLSALRTGCLRVVKPNRELQDRIAGLRLERGRDRGEMRTLDQQAVESTIDRHHERDMTAATCIGPASPGRTGTCGTQIIRRVTPRGQQAPIPLCEIHKNLADRYVLTGIGQAATWVPATRQDV